MLPDQFSHKHNLLDVLFDQIPVAIAFINPDLTLGSFNPAWLEMGIKHGIISPQNFTIGMRLNEISPIFEQQFREIFNRALQDELIQLESLKVLIEDKTSYWNGILMPIKEDLQVVGVLFMLTDETQHIKAKQAS